MDVQDARAARPWLEHARATFPTVVDSQNVLGELFGYKVVPNGIFLDEAGIVRLAKFGGFSVKNAEDLEAIERLLAETSPGSCPATAAPAPATTGIRAAARVTLAIEAGERAAARPGGRHSALERGLELLGRGNRAGALAAWRRALAEDPGNFVIRKQIWAVEHPEKFYPTIDFVWQKEQLASEREAEAHRSRPTRTPVSV